MPALYVVTAGGKTRCEVTCVGFETQGEQDQQGLRLLLVMADSVMLEYGYTGYNIAKKYVYS